MAARKKKHEEHEEHENHERWLVTYADMITLLMVLFIVMFSISQVDLAKYKKFKEGIQGGDASAVVDGGSGMLDGGIGVLPGAAGRATTTTTAASAGKAGPRPTATGPTTTVKSAQQAAYEAERRALGAAEQKLREGLGNTALGGNVEIAVQERGLVITIVADQVLFASGSATLEGAGREVLTAIAEGLKPLPNPVTVEGHTDSVPLGPGNRYSSNWELSTARATSVLRTLVETYGVSVQRMSASGYADTRPIASNDSPDGRSKNRRVELVVRNLVDAPRGVANQSP
ncbi:MAG: flagellar motor protein MotB [Acidimicrobiales bacterium]